MHSFIICNFAVMVILWSMFVFFLVRSKCLKIMNWVFTGIPQNESPLFLRSFCWLIQKPYLKIPCDYHHYIISLVLRVANLFIEERNSPLFWNPKVHYRTHKCPPPVPILSQLHQPPKPPPTSWMSVLMLSAHLRLVLPNGLLPSGFPIRALCTPLPSAIRTTCRAHQATAQHYSTSIPSSFIHLAPTLYNLRNWRR